LKTGAKGPRKAERGERLGKKAIERGYKLKSHIILGRTKKPKEKKKPEPDKKGLTKE